METGLYGKDPDNTAEYYWIGGPELLPHPGFADPRRGLGMLASKDQLPGGVEIRELRGEHSMWFKFPSRAGQVPLYVCCTHVHLASQPLLRAAAFKEITSAVETLKSKGMIIVVGDFNPRAAMNGDTVKDTAGDRFLSFASTNELTVINSLDLCEGNFTRIQDRLRYNKEGEITSRVDKTLYFLYSYVLIHEKWRHKVNRLQILEKADLDSDHCPLLLSLAWTGARIEPATSIQAAPLRKVIKVVGCPSRVANKFEHHLEPYMVKVAAKLACERAPASQEDIDRRVSALDLALQTAAQGHFGVKLVGKQSKPWYDAEVRRLFRLKKYARAVLEAAPRDSQAAILARDALNDSKKTLKYVIRAKRRAKERAACLEIERAMGNSKLFWAKWKARTRGSNAAPAGASVLDRDGKVVCDPLRTLQIWREYTVELGRKNPLMAPLGLMTCLREKF